MLSSASLYLAQALGECDYLPPAVLRRQEAQARLWLGRIPQYQALTFMTKEEILAPVTIYQGTSLQPEIIYRSYELLKVRDLTNEEKVMFRKQTSNLFKLVVLLLESYQNVFQSAAAADIQMVQQRVKENTPRDPLLDFSDCVQSRLNLIRFYGEIKMQDKLIVI